MSSEFPWFTPTVSNCWRWRNNGHPSIRISPEEIEFARNQMEDVHLHSRQSLTAAQRHLHHHQGNHIGRLIFRIRLKLNERPNSSAICLSGWDHRALTHHFRLWSRGNTTSRLFLMGFSAKRCRRLTQRAWWWIVEANGKLGLAIDWADKVFERRAVFQWPSCHSFFTYEDCPSASFSDRFKCYL